jgi:AP-1-like factor
MLNEAKSRNEVLTQAYASLHAEYVQLKTSQIKEQAYQAELGFDPSTALATGTDERLHLDMDLYVYSDMGTYAA